ncbi:MAG: AAA family ATPase [Bacteroides sp.]|nr:AAA family ATPase [Bacteroides sp.]
MILRILENKIQAELYKGKAIIVFGPRQAGKTTLVKSIAQSSGKQVKWLNGDESDVRDLFDHPSSDRLKLIVWSSGGKEALESQAYFWFLS